MNTLERLKLTNLLKKTVDERNAESNTLKRLKLANQVQELRKQLGLIVVEPLTPQQNIENGKKAMQAVIDEQKDVKNAMYRDDIGWIDFVWGDVGEVKANGKTKGGKGISHIIEARMRKDGMNDEQATVFVKNDIVQALALGQSEVKSQKETSTKTMISYQGTIVHLVKNGNDNTWVLTGYEEYQKMEQVGGATNPDLRTNSPIRSRTDVGASDEQSITEPNGTMQAHFNKKIADALIHKNHKVLDVSQVSKVYKIPKHIKNIAFYKNLYGLNELSNLFFAIVENEQGEIYANAYIADTAIDLSRLKHDGVFPDIGVTQLMTEEVEALRSLYNDLDAYFTSYENLNRANKKIIKGRKNSVKTAKGTKIDTVFALVDSKYVIASHTENGNENPKYDQSLQPRDRSRESSIAWVSKTANNLDPESLGRTGRADTGAPIIGDDMMVESGNGRTMAIKLAYKNGKAEEYRQWLIDEADMFGFTEAQVSQFKEPILVRIRTSEIDRATFANYTYKMLHLDCIFKA